MSFRKEKKFRLTISDFYKLQTLLKSQGMRNLYEARMINSLYYDTKNLDMFHDSEEGVVPRKKLRIRWYNKNNLFSVEKKISSIEGRYKSTIPLKTSSTTKNFPKSFSDETYGILTPSLFISYIRSYFEFNEIRITFDSNITYEHMRMSNPIKVEDPERVMEIKVGANYNDDLIDNLIPYTTSRFSKYSRGILFTKHS